MNEDKKSIRRCHESEFSLVRSGTDPLRLILLDRLFLQRAIHPLLFSGPDQYS